MSADYLKERWVAIGGSIACEREYFRKADLGKQYLTRDWIAFNVGERAARHIVDLHNKSLGETNVQHQ